LLADNGVPVTEVADYTGFPEMLDGRVKRCSQKCMPASLHGAICPSMWPRSKTQHSNDRSGGG